MADPTPNVPLFDLTRQWAEVSDDVRAALERVFATQQFILGPEVAALEKECAAYLRVKRAVAVSSGTDALLAVASHCTVHNTLRQHPEVSIELS